MRRLVPVGFVLALVFVLPHTAAAQASITGVVRDSSGALLPGVTVEVASPALIERQRAVNTDASGQYRVVDLPPGTYTVTFSLPGFSAFRREGLALSGQFTATVNAELRVGALTETVTVAGATPMVDVQAAGQSQTMDRETISAMPAPRLYHGLLASVPGIVTSGTQDVGGVDGPVFKLFTAHGGRPNEGQIQVDGMSVGAALNGAGVSYYVSDIGNAEEVTVNLSAGSAETVRGGPTMNVVPRTGGNSFTGSFFASAANGRMQGDNFDDELRQFVRTPNELRSIWDTSASVGGPILRDRAWFYASSRHHGNRKFVSGMFLNRNAGDPNAWHYDPDESQRAIDGGTWKNASVRLTVQASPRNKINIFWDEQDTCASGCMVGSITGGTPTTAPEAHQPTQSGGPTRVQQITWTSPATNRLLFEAGYGNYLARWGGKERPDFNPDLIPVNEQGGIIPGLNYRSQLQWSRHWNGTHTWRGSASYITGRHNLKAGFTAEHLVSDTNNFRNNHRLAYRFNNGVPNRLTMYADHDAATRSRSNGLGFYAQEQWTRRGLTMQGGIRYDRAWSTFPEQRIGPDLFVPQAIVLPASPGVDAYNDITFRGSVVYDLFGDGRTAIKAHVGEYLEAVQNSERYVAANPRNRIVTSVFRNWNDANGDFVPHCDLMNPVANGECGPWQNVSFGQAVFPTTFDPALISGWGVRPNDWQFGVGIQREVLPRLSVDGSYNRRWFGNQQVTHDRSVTAADFEEYSITAPSDPRLPGGGGYVIGDLFDMTPAAQSRPRDNFVTLASNFGKWVEYWHGFDVNANARLESGVRFQGGISLGRRTTDTCDVTPKVGNPSRRFCSVTEPFRTQARMNASYTIPVADVQVSGVFQSVPGAELAANWVVSGANTTLGRGLTGGTATVNLIDPHTMYRERINQLDLRLAKLLRYGGHRTMLALDVYNVTNTNKVENLIQTYGSAWQRPTAVVAARFIKVSAQFDF